MSANKLEPLIVKLCAAGLGKDEWFVILDEWDQDSRIDWSWSPATSDGKTSSSLAVLFSRTLRKNDNGVDLADLMLRKHGDGFWLSTPSDQPPPFIDLLNRDRAYDEPLSQVIKKCANIEDLILVCRDVLKSSPPTAKIGGQFVSDWEEPLDVLALFVDRGFTQCAKQILLRQPHMLTAKCHGITASSMLCTTQAGWNAYTEAGGSIFAPVFSSPHTGAAVEKGVPTWLWLVQKKVYHDGIKSTLESLMMRLTEEREPRADELRISDEDWQKVVENKSKIMSEMRMIAFEKEIESDWKQALKNNKKHWRKWRSSEGANLMHWLAVRHVGQFVKSAHKIKMNQKLISDNDFLGRDILPYLVLGAIKGDWGTRRQEGKLKGDPWKEMMISLSPFLDKNPKKGVLAHFAEASPSSFFKRIERLHDFDGSDTYQQGFLIRNLISPKPAEFWNGFDAAAPLIFASPDKPRVVSGVLQMMMGLTFPSNSDENEHLSHFQALLPETKMICLALYMSQSSVQRTSADAVRYMSQVFDQESAKPINLSSQNLDGMLSWLRQCRHSYMGSHMKEFLSKFEAWTENKILTAQVQSSQDAAPEEGLVKKRRM